MVGRPIATIQAAWKHHFDCAGLDSFVSEPTYQRMTAPTNATRIRMATMVPAAERKSETLVQSVPSARRAWAVSRETRLASAKRERIVGFMSLLFELVFDLLG